MEKPDQKNKCVEREREKKNLRRAVDFTPPSRMLVIDSGSNDAFARSAGKTCAVPPLFQDFYLFIIYYFLKKFVLNFFFSFSWDNKTQHTKFFNLFFFFFGFFLLLYRLDTLAQSDLDSVDCQAGINPL